MKPRFFLTKTRVHTRILGSSLIVLSLCFLLMMFWWILQPVTMAVVLSMEGSVASEGDNAITLIKLGVNYWGVIAVVLTLLTYGIMQAQKKEWRGERVPT